MDQVEMRYLRVQAQPVVRLFFWVPQPPSQGGFEHMWAEGAYTCRKRGIPRDSIRR